MGATHHTLPLPPKSTEALFRSSKVEPAKTCIVIPVHNDWQGLRTTLDSLQELNPRPGNIIVANDNADNSAPEWLESYPVEIVNYEGNRGPAYARNKGSGHPNRKFDWIYFTDCGCRHAKNLFMHFMDARRKRDDSVIAICGSVTGKGSGLINRYMTEMGILNPPFENEPGAYGEKIPQAIITSNALVYAPAFHQLGGFSVDFCEAGGEDLDLGIRLRELGTLVYVPTATVSHEFKEDIHDFKKRFERYGKGNRLLEKKYKLPSLKAQPFPVANVEFRELVKLQTESLRKGYERAKKDASLLDTSDDTSIDNIDGSHHIQSQIAKDVESTKWHLPEGAKLRLGKGKINEIQYSPDGHQRAVASSVGIWIYDTHTGEVLALLTGHTGRVLSIAYSPDGLTLVSGSEDKTICFWDTQTGAHKSTLTQHTESVTALAFSPDGNRIISGSADGIVHVWDAHTGDLKATSHRPRETEYGRSERMNSINAFAFSPDGSLFVSVGDSGTNRNSYDSNKNGSTCFWETETRFGRNQCLGTLTDQASTIALAFSPDGGLFARASKNGTVDLRNGVLGQSIGESETTLRGDEAGLSEKEAGVQKLAFSPDGRTLVGGCKDGSIYVWDTVTHQPLATLKGHTAVVSSVGFSHDGATLISESEDGTICLWDANTGQNETIFTEHLARIRSVKFSPDGHTLMSRNGNGDGDNDTLHLWDVGTGIRKATFTAHSYHIGSAEFGHDSRTLAIWSQTGTLEIWDVETGLPKTILAETVENVASLIFSPDGHTLASWDSDGVILWDVKTGDRRAVLTDGLANVKSATFSPDGCTFASWDSDGVILWDVKTGDRRAVLTDGLANVKSATFSPDGSTLISTSEGRASSYDRNSADSIRLWDVETGKRKATLTKEELSSDNRTFISVSTNESRDARGFTKENGVIHIWDVETGDCKTTCSEEGMGNVTWVLLSPDDRMLISLSENNTDRYSSKKGCVIHIWDVETGTRKATLTEKLYNVKSVLLSSDDRMLISVSKNDTGGYSSREGDVIHIWDMETGTRKTTCSEEGIRDVVSLLLSSDNRTLVSVSRNESDRYSNRPSGSILHFWDVETGTCKATVTEELGEITSVDFSLEGSTLISVGTSRDLDKNPHTTPHLWDVETGARKTDPVGTLTAVTLSPGGSILASGNDEGTILLWTVSK